MRQVLDPSSGLLTVNLEHDDLRGEVQPLRVFCSVNWTTGHVSAATGAVAPFVSVAYYPNLDDEANLPPRKLMRAPKMGFPRLSPFRRS